MGMAYTPLFFGLILLKHFPNSNITDWFKRHIITDEDLENL